MIGSSFKRARQPFSKRKQTEEIIGCSLEFFTNHILSQCPVGVTLENFGRYGYHIDHIIPISLAKTEEQVMKLCHYSNLRPLFYTDNLKKSNKILA